MVKRSKIVCKGNVSAKMASAGVTAEQLQVTTVDLSGASFVDTVTTLAGQIADTVRTALQGAVLGNGETLADTLELPSQNGEGFIDLYVEQIVEDVVKAAMGTAAQGRARKNQLVASNVVPDATYWSADGKAATVAPQDDTFANLSM